MFDIGCDMVASMHLLRDRDFHWRDRSLDGFVYRMHLVLHAPIGRALARFQEQQPERVLDAGASAVSVKHVQLSAHGQRIRSEAPAWDTMDDQGNVILTWRTLPAALAAARTICPEHIPRELVLLNQQGQEVGREALP